MGIRVLLVDTSAPGSNGSMARYAGLVMEALGGAVGQGIEFERLVLSAPGVLTGFFGPRARTWAKHFWNMLRGSTVIRRRRADLVHILDGSYAYLASRELGAPTVVTVHDLIPHLRQKGRFGPARANRVSQWFMARVVVGLQRSERLIADSSNTAKDLRDHAHAESGRISVAPLALPPAFRFAGPQVEFDPEPKTGSGYLLHVGNNGYYKNREGVLRIFSHLPGAQQVRLVMAGPAPTAQLTSLIEELRLKGRVDFVIDPNDDALVELYRRASLFLFPSLYEGFGWPPLEAMACGCPVVCSTEGSLPEVVGDAALTAPAEDEEVLANHCAKVLADAGLAQSLADRGREWVKQFTVERMREDLLSAYGCALAGRSGRRS
jgi:glycosyltransferase involved in cell wall biosynthesis